MAVNSVNGGGFRLIDGVALKEVASAKVWENMVQEILHVNGKGVNEAYVVEGLRGASIAIPWVKLGEGDFRKLGAAINGAQFNHKHPVSADADFFYVPTTFVYDHVEALAKIMNDKAGYALLEAKTANISKKIARGINALTFANQFAAALNGSYDEGTPLYVEQAASGNSTFENLLAANALLGEGDEAIGFDYFDRDARQAFFTAQGIAELKSDKHYVYSDLAAEMLATGVLNPFANDEASRVLMRNGFSGMVDGVPLYEVSPVIFKLATSYLSSNGEGLAPFAFKGIKGAVVAGDATFRGFSSTGDIEVVPAQAGQGWVLQPLVYGGCATVSPKSVRLIVENGFTNPVVSDATKLEVVAPESTAGKLFVTIGDAATTGTDKNKATVTVKDENGNTVTGATIYTAIGATESDPTTASADGTITVTSTAKRATAYATKAGYIASDVARKTLVYTA